MWQQMSQALCHRWARRASDLSWVSGAMCSSDAVFLPTCSHYLLWLCYKKHWAAIFSAMYISRKAHQIQMHFLSWMIFPPDSKYLKMILIFSAGSKMGRDANILIFLLFSLTKYGSYITVGIIAICIKEQCLLFIEQSKPGVFWKIFLSAF